MSVVRMSAEQELMLVSFCKRKLAQGPASAQEVFLAAVTDGSIDRLVPVALSTVSRALRVLCRKRNAFIFRRDDGEMVFQLRSG